MIIQVILTIGFLFIAFYGWAHVRRMRLVSLGMVLLSVVAIYFIWNPAMTTTLANLMGIGRGADLMMYFFFVFVIFQLIILHVKLRNQNVLLTQLSRRIAIDAAQVPEGNEPRP
jgi:small membrane protein